MESEVKIKVPRRITGTRLLLVEGKKDIEVFEEVKKFMLSNYDTFQEVSTIQVYEYTGINNLETSLKYLSTTPEFDSLLSVGITADADSNASNRFQKIKNCITRCGFPAPTDQLSQTSGSPSIIVLVLPRTGEGMIEKLCLDSVKADPAMKCVDKYFECLDTVIKDRSEYPRNIYKAKLQAFLSSRKYQEFKIGYAARKKYFCIENEVFDDVKELLALMIEKKYYNVCIPTIEVN